MTECNVKGYDKPFHKPTGNYHLTVPVSSKKHFGVSWLTALDFT